MSTRGAAGDDRPGIRPAGGPGGGDVNLAHAMTMRRAAGGRVAPPALGQEVYRTALVNRLRAARSQPVVTIVAPAGFGKTTLIAQWREREDRPFTGRPRAEPCVVVV